MYKIDRALTIEKKKNNINSWIEISCPESENEHIKNMLLSLKRENSIYFLEDEKKYIYNISKFTYLKDFLEKHHEVEDILKILRDSIKIQENCINYLIPIESIIFDFHHSFIERKNEQLDLVILPIDITKSVYDFKDWISEMISFLDSIAESEAKEFIDKLFTQINMSNFCLNSLKDFLEREESKLNKKENAEETKEDDRADNAKLNTRKEIEREDIFAPFNNSNYHNYERDHYDLPRASVIKNREDFFIRDGMNYREKQYENQKRLSHKEEEKSEKKSLKITEYKYFYLILFQILMFASLGLLSFYIIGHFSNPKKAISGVLIIWALINYFSSKEILKLANKRETAKRKEKVNKTKKKKKERDSYHVNEKMRSENMPNAFKTGLEEINHDTELLNQYMGERFYLKNLDNRDVFLLNKNINLVGRKFDDVDIFLDDKSASRIHAAILLKNDKVYLQDNNSLNGSYVNYNRIEPNERIPVNVGDEISFSRQRYKLIKQSV